MNSIDIIRIKKEHIDIISEGSAKAYYDDPLFISFFPDVSKRMNLMYLFKMGYLQALKYGEIYVTSNLKGAAAWVPHDKAIMSTWDMIKMGIFSLVFKAKGRDLKKIINYEDFCEKKHKQHAHFPHWYLLNIAVEPDYQRKGYASLLLRDMLDKIDDQNLPCYLETQNKKNVSMYQKFGFKVLEETIVPGTDFEFYLMLRD